jgi:DNA-binding transcriptional ArsR family regulator
LDAVGRGFGRARRFGVDQSIISEQTGMYWGYYYHMRANIRVTPVSDDVCSIPCFKEKLVRKLQQKLPSDEVLEEARILFAALGDRARLKILIALQNGDELCVCDVAHVLGTTISTASHHLRKMRDLKLLKYRNDGRMAYYSLRSEFAGKLAADVLRAEIMI